MSNILSFFLSDLFVYGFFSLAFLLIYLLACNKFIFFFFFKKLFFLYSTTHSTILFLHSNNPLFLVVSTTHIHTHTMTSILIQSTPLAPAGLSAKRVTGHHHPQREPTAGQRPGKKPEAASVCYTAVKQEPHRTARDGRHMIRILPAPPATAVQTLRPKGDIPPALARPLPHLPPSCPTLPTQPSTPTPAVALPPPPPPPVLLPPLPPIPSPLAPPSSPALPPAFFSWPLPAITPPPATSDRRFRFLPYPHPNLTLRLKEPPPSPISIVAIAHDVSEPWPPVLPHISQLLGRARHTPSPSSSPLSPPTFASAPAPAPASTPTPTSKSLRRARVNLCDIVKRKTRRLLRGIVPDDVLYDARYNKMEHFRNLLTCYGGAEGARILAKVGIGSARRPLVPCPCAMCAQIRAQRHASRDSATPPSPPFRSDSPMLQPARLVITIA